MVPCNGRNNFMILKNMLEVVFSTAVLWVPVLLLSNLSAWFCRLLGYRTTVVLGCVGAPIHEISHLILAKLFNHKILAVSLYKPTPDGRLGYVHHAYKKSVWSSLENLLIGLAPIAGGILAFLVVTKLFIPGLVSEYIFISVSANMESVFRALSLVFNTLISSGLFASALWIVLSFSILLFSAPSKSDFYGCSEGIAILLVVLVGLQCFVPAYVKGFLTLVEPCLNLFGTLLMFVCIIMSSLFAIMIGFRYVFFGRVLTR